LVGRDYFFFGILPGFEYFSMIIHWGKMFNPLFFFFAKRSDHFVSCIFGPSLLGAWWGLSLGLGLGLRLDIGVGLGLGFWSCCCCGFLILELVLVLVFV
jgi:hypothetical protein